MERKLPIGIQDFESLRNDGYIYEAKQQSTTSIGVTAPHGCG